MRSGNFASCTISEHASLRDALLSLENSGSGIVLVTSESGQSLGVLREGGIRRALLAGAGLDAVAAKYVDRDFVSVTPSESRADVLEMMRARGLAEVPVIDTAGQLTAIHRISEVIHRRPRPNHAVIMAGGRGSRLGPLTNSVPKPMLRAAGRPILERIVMQVVGAGIGRVFLSVNYLAHIIEEHFGDGRAFGCNLGYLRESRPLGTGGSLSLLPETPTCPLLVMNGDLITQADLGAMLDFHASGGQAVTVGIQRYMHTIPYGCVELDGSRITAVEEKPTLSKVINAGIYVFDPHVISRVPRDREFPLPDLVEGALAAGEIVRAFEVGEDWIDVGERDQLRLARGEVP